MTHGPALDHDTILSLFEAGPLTGSTRTGSTTAPLQTSLRSVAEGHCNAQSIDPVKKPAVMNGSVSSRPFGRAGKAGSAVRRGASGSAGRGPAGTLPTLSAEREELDSEIEGGPMRVAAGDG